MVATDLDQQGRIVQLDKMQKLVYGERDGQLTSRIQQLDETMRGAGFDTDLSTSIMQAMWQKWVYIATLGLMTCLFNAPVGEITAIAFGAETTLQALEECAAVAAAEGYAPAPPFLESVRQQLTVAGAKTTSSMYRDMQQHHKVEADTILGDLLDHGRSHNLKTPLLQAACVRMRVYQNSLSSS